MKEYYRIGEIAKLYDICTDSLRYYEEMGILHPKRDTNGYRMYGIGDIRTLNILRELRAMGLSLPEIKEHLQSFDLHSTLALFRREVHTIDQKLNDLKALRNQITERMGELQSHLAGQWVFDRLELLTLKPRRILQLSEQVERDENVDFVIKKLQKENENQLHLIGNGNIGSTIPLSELQGGSYGRFNSAFCICTGEHFDAILPGGEYLSMTIKGSYSLIPSAWKRLFAYAQEHSLIPDQDPIELYIVDNHDTSCDAEYITQLQVHLQER